jgi:tetratricopeptide (TPR) repeat protein
MIFTDAMKESSVKSFFSKVAAYCLFLVIGLPISPLWCQEKTWSTRHQIIQELCQKGEYREARREIERMRRTIEAWPHQDRAQYYDLAGTVYWVLNDYERAKVFYQQMQLSAEMSGQEDKAFVGKTIVDMIDLFFKGRKQRTQGQRDDSIDTFYKAIDISKKMNRPEFEMRCIRQISACHFGSNRFR